MLEFIETMLDSSERVTDPQAKQEFLDVAHTAILYMNEAQFTRYHRLFQQNQQVMLHTPNLYPLNAPFQRKIAP